MESKLECPHSYSNDCSECARNEDMAGLNSNAAMSLNKRKGGVATV
ncbi:hypothetical protein FHW00_004302 [Ochrobactrum sp. P6BSIII]|jgi:hypothetical protein|nr:hypothetical protein [Ochrobactrum sp. P6BSIII]